MSLTKRITAVLLAAVLVLGILPTMLPSASAALESWPQLTSFSVTTVIGNRVTGVVGEEQFSVTDIKINQNETLKTVGGNSIAGEVIISVDGDFSKHMKMTLSKNTWSATASAGAVITPSTIKILNNYGYVLPAGLKLTVDTTTVCYDIAVVSAVSDANAPKLAVVADSVSRTSEAEATLKFSSDEEGTYFFAVADAAAEAPTVDTSGEGTPMVVGENTVTLSNLTGSAAKKLYLLAKDKAGNITAEALIVEIPAYVPPTYYYLRLYITPSVSTPKLSYATVNGKPVEITENGKKINGIQAGDTIRVWLNIPSVNGVYYNLGQDVKLFTDDEKYQQITPVTVYPDNSFSFTMPDANVRGKSGWYTTVVATETWHSLTATTSLLWPDQGNSEGNRKGTIVFKNPEGVPITRAQAGDTVTAVASPRDGGNWYEFSFVHWTAEGISLPEDQKTNNTITFTMPDSDVALHGEFENLGTEISWSASPADCGIEVAVLGNAEYNPYTYKKGAVGTADIYPGNWSNEYQFVGWTVKRDGVDITHDPSLTYQPGMMEDPNAFGYYEFITFTVGGDKMEFTANFRQRAFASVNTSVNDSAMGSATVTVDNTTGSSAPVVFEGKTVTLTATPGDRYKLDHWEVTDADGAEISVTPDASDSNKATFTMPATGKNITAKAHFVVDPDKASKDCLLTAAELYDGETLVASGSKQGTNFTITLPAGTDAAKVADMTLKLTISDYATVKKSGDTEAWPEAGKACGMEVDTPTTFTVTAEDGKTTADYQIVIKQTKRADKDITAVELLDSGKKVLATGNLKDTTWTLTLPEDTPADVIQNLPYCFLKITHTGASVAMEGGLDDAQGDYLWSSGDVMCNFGAGESKTFTVKAEDGSTKDYTIEIVYTAPDAPTLSGGKAERTSDTAATVKFTTNQAGKYFYKVVTAGAEAPTVATTTGGTNAVVGENTITLTNLTAGARDVYIVVKNAHGVDSMPFKVSVPAFDSGEEPDEPAGAFSVTVSCPTGGTLVPSKTKANAGDKITVTVQPNSGMQMTAGSLSYTLAIAGGETKKIEGNSFTMPAGDVTITCKWETATVVVDGITAFSIDGVKGVVNNSTKTVSVVMPHGTDVTKLMPTVSGNGIQSISPAAGEVVDFTKPVTYTVTLTDGSTLKYTVTVYVQKGSAADEMWDKLTEFYDKTPWWKYAEHQQSHGKYPKYW